MLAAIVAMLAVSGIVAASAGAAVWHVNGEEIKSDRLLDAPMDGSVVIVTPQRDAAVECSSHLDIAGMVHTPLWFFAQEKLSSCTTYSLSSGEVLPCIGSISKTLIYNGPAGTPEKLTFGGEEFKVSYQSGTECPLPLNNPVKIPSFTAAFGFKESAYQPFVSIGTGTFAGSPTTMTIVRTLKMQEGSLDPFGWY